MARFIYLNHKIKGVIICFMIVPILTFVGYTQDEVMLYKGKEALTYRKFQVDENKGRVASVMPIKESINPLWASNVSQEKWIWTKKEQPYFEGPIPFVKPPVENSKEPFYGHNHQPSITWLANGDLMVIWYSAITEQGTELTVLASRMRAGNNSWDPSSEFFKAENHNMHGSSIFNNGQGVLFHFNGMCAKGITKKESNDLALLLRMSNDNGLTWTIPKLINPYYQPMNQAISGGFITSKGVVIQACDISKGKGSNQSAIYVSCDKGTTWNNPGEEKKQLDCKVDSLCGNYIAGIHAGVVELKDGSLMALGRRYEINGKMPKSLSKDKGRTWTYEDSTIPPIGSGQRIVLMTLIEGPILLISFTDKIKDTERVGMIFVDKNGKEFTGHGMFAALSYDDGNTWPVRKLITPCKGEYDGGAWTGKFTATPYQAEHGGYLAATQSPDGIIHLVSSRPARPSFAGHQAAAARTVGAGGGQMAGDRATG